MYKGIASVDCHHARAEVYYVVRASSLSVKTHWAKGGQGKRQEEGIYLQFSPFALFASLLDQKRSHED